MQFEEFVNTVRTVIERDFSAGVPVDVDRSEAEADFTLADGIGKLTLVHEHVQVAYDKTDGSIVTMRHSEPVEPTLAFASRVARFFGAGTEDDVV